MAMATLVTAGCSAEHEQDRATPEHAGVATPHVLGSVATGVIFVSNRSGSNEIYEKNLASGLVTALTTGPGNHMNPQLSPNGQSLAFYSDESGSNQIETLNLASPADTTQLTHETGGVNDYDPTYTPDDHILYKKSDSNGAYGDIWEMNADGSGQHAITASLRSHHQEGWKPAATGNTMAIITIRAEQGKPHSDNLYVLDLSTGATKPLTNDADSNWFPDYSVATGKVAYVTHPGDHDVINTMNLDGSDRKTIVDMPGDSDDPSWAPGDWLAYINNGTDHYNVWAVNVTTGQQVLLDKGPRGNNLSPLLINAG